jgi:hypothetical protein
MNGHRRELARLLSDPTVRVIVVEHSETRTDPTRTFICDARHL